MSIESIYLSHSLWSTIDPDRPYKSHPSNQNLTLFVHVVPNEVAVYVH